MSQSVLEAWGPTAVNVIAVLAAAGIAVWGTIRGAREGAKHGAEATLAATQQAIDADRAAARESEKKQQDSVCLLLSLEVDHNLAILRTLWDEVTQDPPGKYSDDPEQQRREIGRRRADDLIRAPMPVWTRNAWNGLIPLLPLALSRADLDAKS